MQAAPDELRLHSRRSSPARWSAGCAGPPCDALSALCSPCLRGLKSDRCAFGELTVALALGKRIAAESLASGKRPDLLRGDAGNRDALSPAAIAGHDLNGPFGNVQGVREIGDQGVVGGAFDRRGGHADDQRVVPGPGAFGFSGAGNDADVDFDARAGLTNQGRPFDPSGASGRPEQGRGANRLRAGLWRGVAGSCRRR